MHKFLPSKKFTFFLLLLVIIIGVFYAFFIYQKAPAPVIQPETEAGKKVQELMIIDSDNDGLKDWEEALWKTDPNNPDTDGNGLQDGEEINKLRNEKLTATTTTPNTANLTTTEKISQELFLQYIKTRKVDSPLTATDVENIVDNTLAYLPIISFKAYTEKDLTVSSLSDKITLQNYGNAVAEIILTNLKTKTEDIDSIITEASELTDDTKIAEQTKEIFKRFDPLIAKNQKTVIDLKKISVPQIFVPEHLALLNSFEKIYGSLDLMQKSADDLIIVALLRSPYADSAQDLADSLVALTSKIYSLRVNFSSKSDYGYQLFDVIMLKT